MGVGNGKGQREEKACKNNSDTLGLILLIIHAFQKTLNDAFTQL